MQVFTLKKHIIIIITVIHPSISHHRAERSDCKWRLAIGGQRTQCQAIENGFFSVIVDFVGAVEVSLDRNAPKSNRRAVVS